MTLNRPPASSATGVKIPPPSNDTDTPDPDVSCPVMAGGILLDAAAGWSKVMRGGALAPNACTTHCPTWLPPAMAASAENWKWMPPDG